MAITGAHMLLHTPEAEAVRAVLGDVFGLTSVDAGQGWLIYALPPAEIAVHPGEAPSHQITFMCDDIGATTAELREAGLEVADPVDEGWGVQSVVTLPGGLSLMVYEPRHPTAI